MSTAQVSPFFIVTLYMSWKDSRGSTGWLDEMAVEIWSLWFIDIKLSSSILEYNPATKLEI